MTIEFSCSHCNKVLKTSDDKAGRRAKCPQCGEPIDVPLSTGSTSSDDGFNGFDESETESESPVSEEQSFLADPPVREEESFLAEGTIDCLMCGSAIQADAQRCNHCGELQPEREWVPRSIKVGVVYARTWGVFKTNMWRVMGIHILANILFVILTFVTLLALGLFGIGGALLLRGDPLQFLVLGILFYTVLFIVLSVIQIYFILGVQSFLLKLVRGESPGFGEVLSGGPYLGRMLLCTFVFYLLWFIGYVSLIIPSIFIGLIFWPYSYLLIDKNLPGIEAFTESRKRTKGNLLSLFLIYLALLGGILALFSPIMLIDPAMKLSPILGFVMLVGIFPAIFLVLIPFIMLVGTVTYAEMTYQ